MILYRTADGWFVEEAGRFNPLEEKSLDELLAREDLEAYLASRLKAGASEGQVDAAKLLAPVGTQEVWAAGVTYLRSRAARMEESKDAGGGDFYDRVYSAERPELFFKALAHKVVGPGAAVGIRSDATWNVPEPELVLVISPAGKIVGFTIGNDMSSRDIEGQNPLYLPQAKVYHRSCALGPGILVSGQALPAETRIAVKIERGAETALARDGAVVFAGEGLAVQADRASRDRAVVFAGETHLSQMKRKPQELVEYLYRDQMFPTGAFLLTGTGVVPPDSFTLKKGDTIRIAIDGIGELVNPVG